MSQGVSCPRLNIVDEEGVIIGEEDAIHSRDTRAGPFLNTKKISELL